MKIDKAAIKDYGTTLLFFGVATVVAYQPAIMAYVPTEYSLFALIGFGVLSQIAADSRVKGKVKTASEEIDELQAKADRYETLYHDAMGKVDEVQSKVEEGAA